MKMFDHAVIYNGKMYPANTPIEEKTAKKKKVTENADKRASRKSKSTT